MSLPTHNTSRPLSLPLPPLPPSPSPLSAPTSPSLTITVRFTTSDADLSLSIAYPQGTTCASLKLEIRTQRPALSQHKLRLIHSGKALHDGLPLSQLLPPPSRPPPPKRDDPKGKGRREDVDSEPPHIWIHCSVGDLLTPSELATEASPLISDADTTYEATTQPAPSTLPAPLGFDRLLTQGFTETEIAALRSQFNRLNPNLPVEEMRELEDQWIDESVGGQDVGGGAGGLGPTGTYEDMFVGTIIGFFWPVSIWLAREEGVFTPRRQYAVIAGVCVNLFFGLVRVFG